MLGIERGKEMGFTKSSAATIGLAEAKNLLCPDNIMLIGSNIN